MKSEPKIGCQYQRRFVVEDRHLITFADAQMPAVLATPHLIAELEYTARDAIAGLLDPDERTVGVEVEVRHLAPTFRGVEVTCSARVIGSADGLITFQVEASDSLDLLARGVHRRRVVNVDRLRKRIEKKVKAIGK